MAKFIPRYFILLGVIKNTIVFSISFQYCSLMVDGNATDLCVALMSCNFSEFINSSRSVCVCVCVWDFQYIGSCCLWMEIMLFLLFQFFQKALDVSLDFSVYLAASHPGTPRPPCPAWVSCVSPPCVPFPTCPCCHAPPVLSSPVCLASCAVWVWLVPMETTEPAWDWHAVGLHALG